MLDCNYLASLIVNSFVHDTKTSTCLLLVYCAASRVVSVTYYRAPRAAGNALLASRRPLQSREE
jgi:hypothetical protein